MHLGDSCQPQVGAALALADAFAVAHERGRREAEPVAVELQYHVVALVGLYPQRIGAIVDDPVRGQRVEVLYNAFHRAACRVRAERVDTDEDALRLALDDAPVDEVDRRYPPVHRAHDTEGHGGNLAPGVPEDQPEEYQQGGRKQHPARAQVSIRQPQADNGRDHERYSLAGNERVSSSVQQCLADCKTPHDPLLSRGSQYVFRGNIPHEPPLSARIRG